VVARICRALDGLPLAIELAAARAGVLSAEEIEAHLADRFRFLAYLRPVADPRHQALKTAVAWSYELLAAGERQGLRALSVFAGGFDLAAVAVVCCDRNEPAALDLVDLLAGKSLVVCEPAAGGSRYRLLETIRQYAAERLAEAGEAEQARRRHAGTFVSLAERERRLGVLLREHDNFRAALDYALAAGDPAGPRLARALGGFWLARGLLQEGQGWLERALATGPADRRLHADLLRLLGTVLYAAGDIQQARTTLGQAREDAEAAGTTSLQARIRVMQAEIHAVQDGMWAEALQACQAAIPRLEADNDLEGLADAWLLIGKLHFWSGDDPVGTKQAVQRAADCARPRAISGRRRRYSLRCRSCTATSAVSPTPGRLSGRASPYSPEPGRNLPHD
jgi:tetratricopeptide (TPR) repeat protein